MDRNRSHGNIRVTQKERAGVKTSREERAGVQRQTPCDISMKAGKGRKPRKEVGRGVREQDENQEGTA